MDDVKRTTTPAGQPATPNVQREMAKTGRQPGDGVGDTPRREDRTAGVETRTAQTNDDGKPKSVNKEVWEAAEHAAVNMGGFSGVDQAGKDRLIRKQYDQMVQNDKTTKEWAGKDGILGDV